LDAVITKSDYTFAIIGVGPRGGYATECLVSALAKTHQCNIKIYLFEESGYLGCGPVYRPDQPETNWINITERALHLDNRPGINFGDVLIPAFPSYHVWAERPFDSWPDALPDAFPPRAAVGQYLHERANSLINPLRSANIVHIVHERVVQVVPCADDCSIITQSDMAYRADNVLLTIGHQDTKQDGQTEKWSELVDRHTDLEFRAEPYPVEDIKCAVDADGNRHVAIRGYGLAMIDVARALGERFGSFESCDETTGALKYHTIDDTFSIAPFSLDGLTMAPKPHTPKIDSQYVPTQQTLDALEAVLSNLENQKDAEDSGFLIEKMAPIIAQIFVSLNDPHLGENRDLSQIAEIVTDWLKDPEFTHETIMPRDVNPSVTLQSFIDMAMDTTPIYLDYCAGQVWRHCQPIIYSSLSYSALNDEVIAEIIAMDERSKRYSFGPPIASLQQLKALYDAGVLNLDVLNDPDIILDEAGWELSSGGNSFTASVMVDSVLDGPKLKDIVSPLLVNLHQANYLEAVHDELGVHTDNDGYIVSSRDGNVLPIAILGRIAKGTVIGVDAILECFGERPVNWAAATVAKMSLT